MHETHYISTFLCNYKTHTTVEMPKANLTEILYGSECRTLTKGQVRGMDTAEMRFLSGHSLQNDGS